MRPGKGALALPGQPGAGSSGPAAPSVTPWTVLDPTTASKVEGTITEDAPPVADSGSVFTYTLDTTVIEGDPAAMLRYQATIDLDWTTYQVVEIEIVAPEHDAKDVVAAFLAADSNLDAGAWIGVSLESGSSYDAWIRSTDQGTPGVAGQAGPLTVRAVLVCNGDGRIFGVIHLYDTASGTYRNVYNQTIVDAGLTGSTAVIGVALSRRVTGDGPGDTMKVGVRYRLH